MPISAEKQAELQTAFKKYDKSGDGKLSFDEMKALLKRGNPDMGDAELKSLFGGVDQNADGKVDFEEFVAFIYQDVPTPPAGVVNCFEAYAGKGGELDGREFAKMIKESGLFDKQFKQNDVDMIFTKKIAKTKKRAINCEKFCEALEEIALKKGCDIQAVYMKIASMGGPVNSGTKADNVRLNDDKSTFTGAHATGGKHGDAGSHAVRAHNQAGPQLDESTDLSPTVNTFKAFAGKNGTLDQKEFQKMMKDCGVLDDSFNPTDCDLVFTKVVTRGQRNIGPAEFMTALRNIAHKKGHHSCQQVCDQVRTSSGPVLQGTNADAVRFHDDKSTYTGSHVGK